MNDYYLIEDGYGTSLIVKVLAKGYNSVKTKVIGIVWASDTNIHDVLVLDVNFFESHSKKITPLEVLFYV